MVSTKPEGGFLGRHRDRNQIPNRVILFFLFLRKTTPFILLASA